MPHDTQPPLTFSHTQQLHMVHSNVVLQKRRARPRIYSGSLCRRRVVEIRSIGPLHTPRERWLHRALFPLHEIIPPNVVGDYFFKETTPILGFPDKKYHPRAILESQLLSIRSRVESILSHNEEAVKGLKRLLITGGGSTNEVIRQMASDVMGLDVYVAESKEGGSVGGALLGLFAWWRSQGNKGTFEDMKVGWKKDPSAGFRKVASPHHETSRIYGGLIEKYRRCEQRVVKYCARAAEDDGHNWKEEDEVLAFC
jgi:hypothetical protein